MVVADIFSAETQQQGILILTIIGTWGMGFLMGWAVGYLGGKK